MVEAFIAGFLLSVIIVAGVVYIREQAALIRSQNRLIRQQRHEIADLKNLCHFLAKIDTSSDTTDWSVMGDEWNTIMFANLPRHLKAVE